LFVVSIIITPLALPSNFKWKLIFGSYAPSHVATSSQGLTIVEITKATPPPIAKLD
jgi:hypothetical protein